MFDIHRIVRKNVRKLVPYSCARDDYKGREGIFLDANENPFGTMNRYPDPWQGDLKKALSRIKGGQRPSAAEPDRSEALDGLVEVPRRLRLELLRGNPLGVPLSLGASRPAG